MDHLKRILGAGFLGFMLFVVVVRFAHSAAIWPKPIPSELRSNALFPERPGAFLSGPNEGQPLVVALNYLENNRGALQMSKADLEGLILKDSYVSRASGTSHFYFVQSYNGIEVHNGVLNINIARDGSVINVGNRTVPHLYDAIQEGGERLSAVSALEQVANHLGLATEDISSIEGVLENGEGTFVFEGGHLSREPIPVRLVYQPVADGTVRLAWEVVIYERTAENWWRIRIDAATGAQLDLENYFVHDDWGGAFGGQIEDGVTDSLGATAVPSSYLVYAMPVESPHFAVPAPPADARTAEISPWLDAPTASPLGWHATTTVTWTNTQGNNVDSHKDTTRYDCGPTLECDPPLDLTLEPTTPDNLNAALVNLFYWNNVVHDLTYEYGFDELAGNFQDDNFGLGGLGGDRVDANAHSIGSCGGGFATPPDGSPPVMNMYTCGAASPARDGALDNVVVAHEYGHGLTARLTGGPQNVSCLGNAEQMGEGWGDWLGLMMTIEPGDSGADLRTVGTWLFGQSPTGSGIRTYPYTTNMNLNPQTYGDIITAGSSHDVGEIWAAMVWDMVWALIDEHGYNPDFYEDWSTGGNNLAFQLVIEGLKLQPCLPGFVDGRDGILAADQSITGGENQCLIWQAFARRGLGYSASQGSPHSILDGVEAFDLPSGCGGAAVGILERDADLIEGTAVIGATITESLTVSNSGTAPFDFAVTSGALWAETNPSSGTLTPSETVDLMVVFDSSKTAGIGSYTSTLTFSGTYSNDPAPVTLVFHVLPETGYETFLPVVLSGGVGGGANGPGWLVLVPTVGLMVVLFHRFKRRR